MSTKSNYKKKSNPRKKSSKSIIIPLIALIIIVGLAVVLVIDKGDSSKESAALPEYNSKPAETDLPVISETPIKKVTPIEGNGLAISKNDITDTASFYPYEADGTYMEVIAIRASDGTVRTALNTCQVCTGSGRGYYVQENDVLICQNCGNRFTVDQVEVVKGGCNPVPIFSEDKTEDDETIIISHEYLNSNKELFKNWKL